jgi:glycosyltransferase involved in cell wall biosynthesis
MNVVWHCEDRIGAEMAGPGIRVVELARRLASGHAVTVVAPGATTLRDEPFAAAEPEGLAPALRGADVFVAQGFKFPLRSALRFRGRFVLDLYDPVQLEQLAEFGPAPTSAQRVSLAHVRARLIALLLRADHVLCASPQQRAFWLGWLAATGRLAPATLAEDPEARRLLAVVPFGIGDEPPRPGGAALREAIGVAPGTPLALFWGGLWDWMDPALAVGALAKLRDQGRPVHLVFLAGTRPGGDTMRVAGDAARRATAELRLGERVHFLDRWVPYAQRGSVLLEADLAVSAHRPSLEAELAFRTRLLDCLWAGLPPACTRGDALAAEAEREGWGTASDPGDADGLARAMAALLAPGARDRARGAMAEAVDRYRWARSAAVLEDLLAGPAPVRPPLSTPGEFLGERPLAVARALGGKLLRRVWR